MAWLLSGIRPHECVLLTARCGVSFEALARHVRVQPVRDRISCGS